MTGKAIYNDKVVSIIQDTEHHITIKYENGIKESISKHDLQNGNVTLIDMEGNEMGRVIVNLDDLLQEFINIGFLKDPDGDLKLEYVVKKIADKMGISHYTVKNKYYNNNLENKLRKHWLEQGQVELGKKK